MKQTIINLISKPRKKLSPKQICAINLRILRGDLRQKEVAAIIGIKKKRYAAYEEARAMPPLFIKKKLKDHYNLQAIDDLLKRPSKEKLLRFTQK